MHAFEVCDLRAALIAVVATVATCKIFPFFSVHTWMIPINYLSLWFFGYYINFTTILFSASQNLHNESIFASSLSYWMKLFVPFFLSFECVFFKKEVMLVFIYRIRFLLFASEHSVPEFNIILQKRKQLSFNWFVSSFGSFECFDWTKY